MRRTLVHGCSFLAFFVCAAVAQAEPPEKKGDKLLQGMSIVGNDEAPKSLVIVPWKSSELGATLEVSRALDDGRGPVDRDVFARALEYYRIRAGSNSPTQ